MDRPDPLRPCMPESRTRSYKLRTKAASSPANSRPGFTQTDTGYTPDYIGAPPSGGGKTLGAPRTFREMRTIGPAGDPLEMSAGNPYLPDAMQFANYGRMDSYAPTGFENYGAQFAPSGSTGGHDCNCHAPDMSAYRNPALDSAGLVASTAAATANNRLTGFALDLPPTAGAGKFSRQSVMMTAMDNPVVQAALASGQKVVLVRDNNINGKRATGFDVLGNAAAGGNPLYVNFIGDLNADGSQAGGRQATFTFPDGSTTAAPGASSSSPTGYAPAKQGCGCHGSAGDEEEQIVDPVANPCNVTSSRKKVTDITQSTGTARKEDCPEPEDVLEGYFYVTNKEGDDTHHASRQFFRLMNDCAGGIFDLNHRTGLVKLKPGKTTADIDKIEVNARQSRILAKTIYDATQGGKGINGSAEKQVVRMRVLRQNDEEVDNFSMDDFNSGFVDLDDYQDTMKDNMPDDTKDATDVEEIFTDGTALPNTIIAPALIGHAIRERYAMKDYEQYVASRRKVPKEEYERTYRQLGDARASQILIEMTKAVDSTFNKVFELCQYEEYENLGVRMQFYPRRANWELAILLYSSTNPKHWFAINSGYLRKKK